MGPEHWGTMTPQTVSAVVNFNRQDPSWEYAETANDMYAKQAEGVAFLWNRLSAYRIALLADEVGMGKTFQALSVCALLWRLAPDSRVLVVAPRAVVVDNWADEYSAFLAQHVRRGDDLVKAAIGGVPVHPANKCSDLFALSDQYALRWPHFLLAKTSSFSNLLRNEDRDEADVLLTVRARARQIREELIRTRTLFDGSPRPPFDLMIIDEAHYFRAKRGGSQKVNAAEELFSPTESLPIADRVLLLSATPNHSSERDVETVASYFRHDIGMVEPQSADILNAVGLRRLRRLEKLTKYDYRLEAEIPFSFAAREQAASEVFFALYQKRLAEKRSQSRYRDLFGYLEGFEAIPEGEPDNSKNAVEEPEVDPSVKTTQRGSLASASLCQAAL